MLSRLDPRSESSTDGNHAMSDQDKRKSSRDEAGAESPAVQPGKGLSARSQRSSFLPPWRVLLHVDDRRKLDRATQVVRVLTPLSKEEAAARAREANEVGVALLLLTHQERAELYVEQFASCQVRVTTEPAD